MPKAASRDGVFTRPDRAGFYISYVDGKGKRHKKRVQAHTRTQALEALRREKSKAEREAQLGIVEPSDITTEAFFARYQRHQKTRTAATTYERLGDILARLKQHLPPALKMIDKSAVAAYIDVRAESVKPGTIAKEISTLKHALGLAADDWGLINSNPAAKAKLPKMPEGRTKYLSPTELRAALEKAPEWMRAPIALAAFTAMRRGELLKLTWKDVDLAGRRVYLQDTKNGTLGILPLNDLALGVLQSLPHDAPSDLVLPGVDPQKLSVYTRRLFASLKIEGASFHTLRHTAASWLAMSGAGLYEVGEFLRHKTPRMTKRYSHLSPDYMAKTASRLDGVFAGTLRGLSEGQTDANASERNQGAESGESA